MELYPWQNDQWQKVMRMRGRMPHALLLQGRNGIGKRDFALALAKSLLCDLPLTDHSACGQCRSCNWFTQGNHPDFRLLELEAAADSGGEDGSEASKGARKTQISVDQVRTLADFLGLSSHRSGLRIILLHPAEALNQASANALLKMLEEPPPNVLFLLVTHQPQHLLPTIRSRCSQFDMPIPPRSVAEKWLAHHGIKHATQRLAYVGGAPLRAMDQDDESEKRLTELHNMLVRANGMDPFAAAALCTKDGLAQAVDILQKWTFDLLGMNLTGITRFNIEQAPSLQGLAKRVDLPKLLDFQRILTEARRFAQHPLNAELQVESLMIQYTQIFTMPPKP